jgi:fibronectin type 3 domain-containing protein
VKKVTTLFLIALILILTLPVSSAFAYTGGVLDGVTMIRSDLHTTTKGGTTKNATDNNQSTYIDMEKWGYGAEGSLDTIWYELPVTKTLNAIKVKVDVAIGYFSFFDASGNVIKHVNFNDKIDQYIYFDKIVNVKKIAIINGNSSTAGFKNKFYEVNAFFITSEIPVNLTAIANQGQSSVILNWDLTNGAKSYNVKRSTTVGGPYTNIGTSATNSYVDSYAEEGVTYYYVVTGVNDAGESSYSNEATATLMADVPDAPTNLIATGNNDLQSIQLNWDTVTGATYYSVKRSTDEGGPYVNIASGLTDTAYDDADVTPGIIYYYVVTAINEGVGSVNSNEASAVLEEIIVEEEGRAILEITMVNELVKEYDLSMIEVNAFLSWYDAKDAGSGPAKYAFTKTWNKGPFKARTEYVIFDKILTFNVDEYDVVE